MRISPKIAFALLLCLGSAIAEGPASSVPARHLPDVTSSSLDKPYQELMQQIARRADPLDQEDIRQIERRAQTGSREDQLTMGCLLTLGPEAQVTSPVVPSANPQKAAEYFEMAAHNGSREAQFLLGAMQLSGTGLPMDRLHGAMWIEVASTAGFKPAIREARQLKSRLSSEELSSARRLASDWLRSHPTNTH